MEARYSLKLLYLMLIKYNIPTTKAKKLAKAIDSLDTYEFNSLVKVLKPLSEDID